MRDMKRVYNTTRLLGGQKTVQSKPVKDKNGVVLTRTEDQLSRWKEHFSGSPEQADPREST